MILFLYGDDTYRSKQKLDAIKAKYIDASLGDTNLSVLDFEDKTINFDNVVREILALPFLAKSRLVILKNLLTKGKKDLQDKFLLFIPKIPSTTNLVVYESGVPDKRTMLFKKLNILKFSQEFKPLEGYQLKKWIEDEIKNFGKIIELQAINKLIEYVGNDLWRMSNEISKLVLYTETKETKKIETQDIEELVKPKIEGNIFALIDALGQKNIKNAMKNLHNLLEAGENELYIFTMIIYQFRNLLIIKDILENLKFKTMNFKQVPNAKLQISKLSGLNPYVVQKTIAQTRNFTFDELKTIYKKLFTYDIKMKTGEIDQKIALDLLVVELCL